MRFIFLTITKGTGFVLGAYIFSFLFEKITRIPLLWWNLRTKSNVAMANGAANLGAIFYFVVNIIVLFISLRSERNPEGYSFVNWLFIIIPLTIIFRKIHYKLTPIDPNRDNFDISD